MKRKLIMVVIASAIFALFAQEVYTNVAGAPAGRSGGAGEFTCAVSGCHTGSAVNSGPGTLTITSDAVGNIYVPGMTYTITVTMEQSGINRFGFEVLYGHHAGSNTSKGTGTPTSATETQHKSLSGKKYITHRQAGTSGSSTKTWTFSWAAPAVDEGPLSFYVAGNATNSNNSSSGDLIYTSSLTLNPPPVGVEDGLNTSLQVYPSVTDAEVNVHLKGVGLEPISLRLIDGTGRTIHTSEVIPVGTEAIRQLDLSGEAAGIYYLEARIGGKTEVQKVVKR